MRIAIAAGIVSLIIFLTVLNINRSRVDRVVPNAGPSSAKPVAESSLKEKDATATSKASPADHPVKLNVYNLESPEITAALERREQELVKALARRNEKRLNPLNISPPEAPRSAAMVETASEFRKNLEAAAEDSTLGNPKDDTTLILDGLETSEGGVGAQQKAIQDIYESREQTNQPTSSPIGYVYAQKRLSLLHETGVVGIEPGSRLAVLERRGQNLLVSYDGFRGEVPIMDTRANP